MNEVLYTLWMNLGTPYEWIILHSMNKLVYTLLWMNYGTPYENVMVQIWINMVLPMNYGTPYE